MNYAIIALATWRLSSLLSNEDGPFGLFDRLRHAVGVMYKDTGEPYGTNEFSKAVLCLWCNSLWIGLVLSVLYYVLETSLVWACLPFALSTVAIGIDQCLE